MFLSLLLAASKASFSGVLQIHHGELGHRSHELQLWCLVANLQNPQSLYSPVWPRPSSLFSSFLNSNNRALAGVAQWVERPPENQSIAGLIPSQGLGCGLGPQ